MDIKDLDITQRTLGITIRMSNFASGMGGALQKVQGMAYAGGILVFVVLLISMPLMYLGNLLAAEGEAELSTLVSSELSRTDEYIARIMVADPNSVARSEQLWDASIIVSEARDGAGSGGPLWVLG